MTICLASLVSGLVALYLHLWKAGRVGSLACGPGGNCELVQHSSWSYFLGVDVALIGTVGYGLLFAVSLLSLQPRWADARGPTLVMAVLIGAAVLFTLRLKYAEFVILRSFCPWCAVSAVAITLCAVMAALDWRRLRPARGYGATTAGVPDSARSYGA
ncbi:MAG TPA: vitamin K epoxide reductase family protein [Gemmatimonadales bacterium]|nr:vitamin K epoxide reductase family protein [Gemmatimonadales bacterium]